MRLPRSAMLRSAMILDLMSPEGSKSKITTVSDMVAGLLSAHGNVQVTAAKLLRPSR